MLIAKRQEEHAYEPQHLCLTAKLQDHQHYLTQLRAKSSSWCSRSACSQKVQSLRGACVALSVACTVLLQVLTAGDMSETAATASGRWHLFHKKSCECELAQPQDISSHPKFQARPKFLNSRCSSGPKYNWSKTALHAWVLFSISIISGTTQMLANGSSKGSAGCSQRCPPWRSETASQSARK